MKGDDPKIRFIAIAQIAAKADIELDFDALSRELGVTRKKLRGWAKEINEQSSSESVLAILDLDESIIDAIAHETVDKASDSVSGPQLNIHPVSGKITIMDEKAVATEKVKKKKVAAFKDSVAGLQLLKTEVQGTAGVIIGRIADLMEDENSPLTPRDLTSLTSALCNVQQAFFNHPTTNIQVNTMTGGGEGTSLLSAFKSNQKG